MKLPDVTINDARDSRVFNALMRGRGEFARYFRKSAARARAAFRRDAILDPILGALIVRALPAGGATMTTASRFSAAAEGRPVFDVTAKPYGAVGDDVADDNAAIVAAIAAIPAAGGTLLLPAGKTFFCNSTTIAMAKSHVHIEGYGATLRFTSAVRGLTIGGTAGVTDVSISGLRITNTAAGSAGAAGRGAITVDADTFACSDIRIVDCVLDDIATTGLVMTGSVSAGFVSNCVVRSPNEHGFYFSAVSDVTVTNCQAYSVGDGTHSFTAGFKVANANTKGVTITGCLTDGIQSNGAGFLTENTAAAPVTFTACDARLNGTNQIGFRIDITGAVITAATVDGGAGFSGSSAFDFRSTAANCVVVGGLIKGVWQTAPVIFRTTATHNKILGVTMGGAVAGIEAIDFGATTANTAEHCTILDGDYGINFRTSTSCRALWNTIYSATAYLTASATTPIVYDATATPTANRIPLADATNKLAAGWLSKVLSTSDLSDLSGAVNAANGTVKLDAGAKVPLAQISEVLASSDLSDVSGAVNAASGLVLLDANARAPTAQLRRSTVSKSANASLAVTDEVVLASGGAGGITLTLPAPAAGLRIIVKKVDAAAGSVTVARNAADTIDGATTYVLSAQWQGAMFHCDGTNWYVV